MDVQKSKSKHAIICMFFKKKTIIYRECVMLVHVVAKMISRGFTSHFFNYIFYDIVDSCFRGFALRYVY